MVIARAAPTSEWVGNRAAGSRSSRAKLKVLETVSASSFKLTILKTVRVKKGVSDQEARSLKALNLPTESCE